MGQVIKGWDEGMIGQCLGEKRRIYIPANLAYGMSLSCQVPESCPSDI